MAKWCFIESFEINGGGVPPAPNTGTVCVRYSDADVNPPLVESSDFFEIPLNEISISGLNSRIRQKYSLGPLVEINWPFNAKGDLL
ncbi:MAG: hypothetical protein MN733_09970 [Nitrososphaera sp.]|nr:hypothetical protein [Nitrososphaera sp.]